MKNRYLDGKENIRIVRESKSRPLTIEPRATYLGTRVNYVARDWLHKTFLDMENIEKCNECGAPMVQRRTIGDTPETRRVVWECPKYHHDAHYKNFMK